MNSHYQTTYQGKVKTFFQVPNSPYWSMFFSDYITAGDGRTKDQLEGLGLVRCQIASLIFEYLNQLRIKTHYVGYRDDCCLEILPTIPIQLEIVVRFEADGSYLRRYRKVKQKVVLYDPVIEIFYKDDTMHDPMLKMLSDGSGFETIHPQTGYFFDEELFVQYEEVFPELILERFCGYDIYQQLVSNARYIATTVRNIFWPEFSLIDIKLEFGWHPELGIILIDGITPDEWRLRRNGDGLRFDKDLYREFGSDQLSTLLQRYQVVRDYLQNILKK